MTVQGKGGEVQSGAGRGKFAHPLLCSSPKKERGGEKERATSVRIIPFPRPENPGNTKNLSYPVEGRGRRVECSDASVQCPSPDHRAHLSPRGHRQRGRKKKRGGRGEGLMYNIVNRAFFRASLFPPGAGKREKRKGRECGGFIRLHRAPPSGPSSFGHYGDRIGRKATRKRGKRGKGEEEATTFFLARSRYDSRHLGGK